MDSKSILEKPFTALAPPVFNGEGYHVWAARMEAHLEANDLWEAVEEDYEVLPLPANPTMAQIKYHKERKSRKSKARAMLFAAVSSEVFVRIMTLKSAFEVWNFLKKEFEGDEKIKGMKVLNLIREFELQKMKDSETVKEYSDKLLGIANKVRLLGSEFSDSRIVQKIFVTVPERFDATISSLENTKDLSNVSLAELLNALQAQEQRRLMRSEGSVEGALTAKAQPIQGEKEKKNEIGKSGSDSPNTSRRTKFDFPLCKHCGRKGHPPFKCWKRPDQKCEKCQKMGHHKKICRSNTQQTATEENLQQRNVAQVADLEEKEEHLFVASCFATNNTSGKWIVDSGCTNHMTFDRDLFKELDTSITFKVRIGNDKYIVIKGKGTVAIESSSAGVASGATRAALTQHFSLQNNAADISAKEGSQETVATMSGMILGMLLAQVTKGHPLAIWLSFLSLTVFHIYANYKAVSCLSLSTLNSERTSILLQHFMETGKVLSPKQVSCMEHILPVWSSLWRSKDSKLLHKRIKLGVKVSSLNHIEMMSLLDLAESHSKKVKYLLMEQKGVISIVVHKEAAAVDILQSYVHALAIGNLSRKSSSASSGHAESLDWMNKYYKVFIAKLQSSGWKTERLLASSILWWANWFGDTSNEKVN